MYCMYSTNTDTAVVFSTHNMSTRANGSCTGLVMAFDTHLQNGESWGNFFIVTIAPSVRLANDGRIKAGQAPFGWYRFN